MDAQDLAKLAGIVSTPKAKVEQLSDEVREIAMLAGVVPASGRSALVEHALIPDASPESTDIGQTDESFLAAMTRAANISPALLEDGVSVDISEVPVPVIAPPVFEPPPGVEVVEAAEAPRRVTVQTQEVTPQWAYDLRTAVEGLLDKSLPPKEALKAMQDALKASYEVQENAAVEPPAPVMESEEHRLFKAFYQKSLQS